MTKKDTKKDQEAASEAPDVPEGFAPITEEGLMIEELGTQVAQLSKEVAFWKTQARIAQARLQAEHPEESDEVSAET